MMGISVCLKQVWWSLQGPGSSFPFLWTVDLVAHLVCLHIHTGLIDSVLGAQMHSQGSTAVHIAFPDALPDRSRRADRCCYDRASQFLAPLSSGSLGTLACVELRAGGAVPTGGDTGLDQRGFTQVPRESTRTLAPVVPHAHASVLTLLLTQDRLYLAARSLPPFGTDALVDINTASSVQTGRCAGRCQALWAAVVR